VESDTCPAGIVWERSSFMQDASWDEAARIPPESLEPALVEDGIWRVPVPVPYGTHATNVYFVRGQGESANWCMVDSPLGAERSEEALRAGFARAGITERDFAAIVLTHSHPSHLGAIGYWQRIMGVPVYALPLQVRDIPSLWEDPANTALRAAATSLVAHGVAADEAQALVTRAVEIRNLLEFPVHPVMLGHQQHVRLAGSHFQVLWTPGHADGHICLMRDDGVLLAGDAVLPAPAHPPVGWYPWSRPDPLRDQMETLSLLSQMPARLVLPGHGQPYTNLNQRAGELAGIYTREVVAVARLLADTPAGLQAIEVARQLYSAHWHTSLSRMMAISEAIARLEHLRLLGRAERTVDEQGRIVYSRAHEDTSGAPITENNTR